MRLSELGGKEIVCLDTGAKLGVISDSDLVINPDNGMIQSIILPGGSFFGFGKKREDMVIPWNAIVKIGPDMIIIQQNKQEAQVSQI